MLNTIKVGNPKNPPLIIAHGLFGSAKNWGVMSRRLSDEWYVISVDMRNHGNSSSHPDHNYEAMADDLEKVIKYFGGYCSILGHSMGGKAFMYLALHDPKIVAKLIVVDIAPINYDHSQIDIVKALQSIDLKLVKSRRDADNVLASFIEEKEVRDFLLQNLKFESHTTWDLNLTNLEKNMEKILNFPSSNQVFNGETLLIVGENSTYVSADNISVMRKKFPDLRVKRIGGAGHWVHVEKPIEFERSVREFLSF